MALGVNRLQQIKLALEAVTERRKSKKNMHEEKKKKEERGKMNNK